MLIIKGEITSIFKSTDGNFYATVHSHPNVQSTHRLSTLEQIFGWKPGSVIQLKTWWENDYYNVEVAE